ncbi:MAG: DNA-binding NtrC family response regulator [Myxococcota bacterium]|jgi:DNA-binding NtrC family response regulator
MSRAANGKRVLVVDDDPVIALLVEQLLSQHGYDVETVDTGRAALKSVGAGFEGVIVLDVKLPDIDGPSVFRGIRQTSPDCPVIFLTSHATTHLALDSIRGGAFEFIEKTQLHEQLLDTVNNAFDMLAATQSVEENGPIGSFGGIVTQAREMHGLFRAMKSAFDTSVSVLVYGESGTGKELVSQALHRFGPRAAGPFVAINCAGIPENLLEAELFGYERGAFTGAVSRKAGKFEAAQGGSILLDEIGELQPVLQAKLLRVVQEGEFQRLGGNETIKSNVRIISATNRDLLTEVEAGRFRADLYYRLAVFTIHIPPLRERAGDVSLLVQYFADRAAKREGKVVSEVDPRAMELLRLHDYPGNVRELENIVAYAVVSARSERITISDLPPAFLQAVSRHQEIEPAGQAGSEPTVPGYAAASATPTAGGFATLAEVERVHIEHALERAGGNRRAAAELLGISRMTLYRKLKFEETT